MKIKIPEHYVRNGLFRKKVKEQVKEIPDSVLNKIFGRKTLLQKVVRR